MVNRNFFGLVAVAVAVAVGVVVAVVVGEAAVAGAGAGAATAAAARASTGSSSSSSRKADARPSQCRKNIWNVPLMGVFPLTHTRFHTRPTKEIQYINYPT